MKFDAIVGNPPYQKQVGERKTEPLWHIFVENSIKSLKDGGYLCLVHPPGWRDMAGRYSDVGGMLMSKDVQYLEMHTERDGVKTFNASIPYDWYVVKNSKATGKTNVKFQDGVSKVVDLNAVPFVPNGGFDKIMSLFAKNGEEKCEVLYDRTAYGTDKFNMSEERTAKFKYPVIYTVTKGDTINLWYSSEKTVHFGIPKVIWSNGMATGFIVDDKGKYGLTQFAYAIVDDQKNLENIKKALTSEEFKKLIFDSSVAGTINRKVIALFRKDFWKDFI